MFITRKYDRLCVCKHSHISTSARKSDARFELSDPISCNTEETVAIATKLVLFHYISTTYTENSLYFSSSRNLTSHLDLVQLISYKMATKCLLRMQMKKPYFTSGRKFDVRFEFSAPDFLFQTGIWPSSLSMKVIFCRWCQFFCTEFKVSGANGRDSFIQTLHLCVISCFERKSVRGL